MIPAANSDGLYRMADFDVRMVETMAEYEAIEDDETTSVAPLSPLTPHPSPLTSHSYTLGGVQATDSYQGIVIENGRSAFRARHN